MISETLKHIALFVVFVLINNMVVGQQIYLEVGSESASFKEYVNDIGANTLDASYSKSQALFFEAGCRLNLHRDRLQLNLGMSHNNYKINTGFYSGNGSVPVHYEFTYIAFKAGVIFSFLNTPKFKLQGHSHISSDWLISGTSSYNNVVHNLYDDQTFTRDALRYHRGVSAAYTISNRTAIYLNYNVADSFKHATKDSNTEESYSLHSKAFSFGILFSIQPLNTY